VRGSNGPSDTDGSASVAPTAMEAVDEEAEEATAELEATKEPSAGEKPSGGDASIEEAATQVAP
jgi:hypothetical protein